MLPALAHEGLVDAVDAFCEKHRLHARADAARVRSRRPAHGLRVKLHAEQLSNMQGAALAARVSARCRPIISNTSTRRASPRWRRPAPPPCCCRARSTSCARRACRRIDLLRAHGVPMALATDCNPGTSPLTSLLLVMNMAATLFRMTVDECLVGVTRAAAQALGMRATRRHARSRQTMRPRDLERRASGGARLSHGPQPAARARLERRMSADARTNGWPIHHGDAPLIVSFPHTGTEIPAGHRSAARLAVARAQGRGLLGRRALRLRARDGRHHRPHRAVAHRHRRESRSVGRVAVSRAGDHRPVPASTPSTASRCTARAQEPDAAEIARRRRGILRPVPRRARSASSSACARTAPPRRALRRAFDPLAGATAVRRRAAAVQHRHEQWRELRRRLSPRTSRRSAPLRRSRSVTNGRFRGGWITRHYGKPQTASTRCKWSLPCAVICTSREEPLNEAQLARAARRRARRDAARRAARHSRRLHHISRLDNPHEPHRHASRVDPRAPPAPRCRPRAGSPKRRCACS